MKREIKFRAWLKATDYHKGLMIYSEDDLGDFFDHKIYGMDVELMQFTGLLDKNGTPIFEGDIVSKEGAIVVYDSVIACWCFYFKNDEAKPIPLFYNNNIKKCEVIGNIYQNPELLK